MMNREQVLREMRSSLADVSSAIDWENIEEDDKLVTDLGFDSLTMMLVSIKIEDAFGVAIPDSQEFITVGDVCDFLERHIQ